MQPHWWLKKSKKVSWLQRLSGRMQKPSDEFEISFAIKWTGTLAGIPASHFRSLGRKKDQKILDTFGLTYEKTFVQSSLFTVSSKMSGNTSIEDFERYSLTFERWVTGLKQSSVGRQRQVKTIIESVYSSWLPGILEISFPTPIARDYRNGRVSKDIMERNSRPLNEFLVTGLRDVRSFNGSGKGPGLLGTPRASDGLAGKLKPIGNDQSRLEYQLANEYPDGEYANPDYLEQMMGFCPGHTNLFTLTESE